MICRVVSERFIPCPFCKEPNYLPVAHYLSCNMYAVLCGACGASGPRARTEPEARELWNRRDDDAKEVSVSA